MTEEELGVRRVTAALMQNTIYRAGDRVRIIFKDAHIPRGEAKENVFGKLATVVNGMPAGSQKPKENPSCPIVIDGSTLILWAPESFLEMWED